MYLEKSIYIGVEYGEWYMDDINLTIEMLTDALKDDQGSDFYYRSSW